jgi:hypothetical protein
MKICMKRVRGLLAAVLITASLIVTPGVARPALAATTPQLCSQTVFENGYTTMLILYSTSNKPIGLGIHLQKGYYQMYQLQVELDGLSWMGPDYYPWNSVICGYW